MYEDYYYGIAGVLEIQLTNGLPFDKGGKIHLAPRKSTQ
jgi:hypothetical protein